MSTLWDYASPSAAASKIGTECESPDHMYDASYSMSCSLGLHTPQGPSDLKRWHSFTSVEQFLSRTAVGPPSTDELNDLHRALSTRPSAFPTAGRKGLHVLLVEMLSTYALPPEQIELAGKCLLALETQVFPPALKSGGGSSWRWVSPAAQKQQSLLDRANLPQRLKEYTACLSDPAAPKNQPVLGKALSGMITAADFFREELHPTDDVQLFEQFLISQLEEDTVQSLDSSPRGLRVIRDKPALQVAGAWVRALYGGISPLSSIPQPLGHALLDQCLIAIGKPLEVAVPAGPQGLPGAAGLGPAPDYPPSRPTQVEHVALVALRVLRPLLALQPSSLESSLPALETLAAQLLHSPGAHVEVELALLHILLPYAKAVSAGFDPGSLLKSFLQVSLPATWQHIGICLETFQLIRHHGEEMEEMGQGILASSFPFFLKMVAAFPLALAEDAVEVLPLLISPQDITLQCSAVLDLPFLAMALEHSQHALASATQFNGKGSFHGLPAGHAVTTSPSEANTTRHDGDTLQQQAKAQSSHLWSLLTSLGNPGNTDGTPDESHAAAKVYLETLFACNQSIDLRQCPSRAESSEPLLLEAAAACLDSPRIRFLCERLATDLMQTLSVCVVRDAADPVLCSVLKATLQRRQLPFPHRAYASATGEIQQQLVTTIIQRLPATLGLLQLQVGRCITDVVEGLSQDVGMASTMIWAIGEYMQTTPVSEPGLSVETGWASGETAALQQVLPAGNFALVEVLEEVVMSTARTAKSTQERPGAGQRRTGLGLPGREPSCGGNHLEELRCLSLSSLTKLAARFQPLASRLELLLGKVVVSSSSGELVRWRAVESLGLLREPDIAAAIFGSAGDPVAGVMVAS